MRGRDVGLCVQSLHHHHNHHHHGLWKTEIQSHPTGGRGRRRWGSGREWRPDQGIGLGLLKTVVIHSVLQWFMSIVGTKTNLAHGLCKAVGLRTQRAARRLWQHAAHSSTDVGSQMCHRSPAQYLASQNKKGLFCFLFCFFLPSAYQPYLCIPPCNVLRSLVGAKTPLGGTFHYLPSNPGDVVSLQTITNTPDPSTHT